MAITYQLRFRNPDEYGSYDIKDSNCSGIKRKHDRFLIKYAKDGVQDIVEAVTIAKTLYIDFGDTATDAPGAFTGAESDIWYNPDHWSARDLRNLNLTISAGRENKVNIRYYAVNSDKTCTTAKTITADKAGLLDDAEKEAAEAAAEAAAQAAFEEIERDPHATLYVASMNVSINSETGLINQGAFKLRWNDLEKVPLWNSGVRSKYIAIQKGEVEDNSVALMKEQVWLPPVWDFKTYNSYADLNTGKHQQSPTLTRVPTDPPTFRVNYGNSNAPVGEEKGLKNKYKRFRGSTYTTGMALAIDDIVKVAMKGMRPKSEFNFKQVDTNTRFKKEFLSLFNRVPATTETIDTTTSATTMMSR